jgi:Helix-turn-helix domain
VAAPGRPRSLDDGKRREICALLTAGYPMYAAADYVGCSPRTIKREIRRNSEFADRVRRAETAGQLEPLSTVRNAAKSDWRAAAWYLERTNPSRFAKRNPVLFKPEDVLEHLETIGGQMLDEVKDEPTRDRIFRRMLTAAGMIRKAVHDHRRYDGSARPVSLNAAADSKFPDLPTQREVEAMLNGEEFDESHE